MANPWQDQSGTPKGNPWQMGGSGANNMSRSTPMQGGSYLPKRNKVAPAPTAPTQKFTPESFLALISKPPTNTSDRPGFSRSQFRQAITGRPPAEEVGSPWATPEPSLPQFGRTLEDYLAELQGSGFGSEATSGIDARTSAIKQQAASGDAKIKAIYDALSADITGLTPQIAGQYSDAQAATEQNTAASAAAASQGYNDSAAVRNEVRANLGMEDAPVDNTAAAHQTAATGDIGQRGQVAGTGLIDASNNYQGYNTEAAKASMQTGAGARAALQTDLLSALASLQDQRSSASANSQSAMYAQATDMFDRDYGMWQDQRNYADSRDDLSYNRASEAANNAAKNAPEPYQDTSGYGESIQRLSAYGVDNSTASTLVGIYRDNIGNINPNSYLSSVRSQLIESGVSEDDPSLNTYLNEAYQYYLTNK